MGQEELKLSLFANQLLYIENLRLHQKKKKKNTVRTKIQ